MAEIDIQQRKRPVWPWIVGVLVLALAIWGIAELAAPGDEFADTAVLEEPVPPAAETQPVQPMAEEPTESDAVAQYAEAARGFATADMGRQHEATATAIQRLIPALLVVVERDPVAGSPVHEQLEELRSASTRIQQSDWTADTHANEVKSAFTTTADLLAQLHEDLEDAGGEPGVMRVREAADALEADRPLLEQREVVQRFFSASADAIERLARRS